MATHGSRKMSLKSLNSTAYGIRRSWALALGVVLMAVSCAGAVLRWPKPRAPTVEFGLDSMVLDGALAGNARAQAALRIAIERRPVARSESLLLTLAQRCNEQCDGLEAPILLLFDRVARAGKFQDVWSVWKRRPLRPIYRTPSKGVLQVGVAAPGGFRTFVDPVVGRALVEAVATAPQSTRSLAELVGSSAVGRALCDKQVSSSRGSRALGSLRRAFCATTGAPSGDVDQLCATEASGGIAGLSEAEQARIRSVCASLGPASSANSVLPPNLAMYAGQGCYELTEAEAVSGIHPDAVVDAEILQATLDCIGSGEDPARAPTPGPIAGRLEFEASTDESHADDPGPWVMPTTGRDGWAYKFNVLDARSNAENAAHVGEPGFIAVFAVEPSGDATGAVAIVATSPEGSIAQIILEFFTDPDDIDLFVAITATKSIRAAIDAIKLVFPVKPDPSATPDPSASESASPSPTSSPSETPAPSPSADGTDRIFGGPGSKPGACRRLEALILAGPSGAPLRGPPDLSRPPADPRVSHDRKEAEGLSSLTCRSDAQPIACGAVDCAAGLHVDEQSCRCSRSRSFEADPVLGCAALRCTEGSHGEAVGPGCVCASDEGRALSRPAGPPGRGWGFQVRTLER